MHALFSTWHKQRKLGLEELEISGGYCVWMDMV